MHGQAAIDWLAAQGELVWRLEEEQPGMPPPTAVRTQPLERRPSSPVLPPHQAGKQPPQAHRAVLIPKRLPAPASSEANWSREVRRIFALVDGTRTLDDIASLLRRPHGEVLAILRALEARGFIEF